MSLRNFILLLLILQFGIEYSLIHYIQFLVLIISSEKALNKQKF